MTIGSRVSRAGLTALLLVAAACQPPLIEGRGGNGVGGPGGGGESGGGGGGGGSGGGAGGRSDGGPGFTISLPDGGPNDGPRSGSAADAAASESCAGEIHEGKLVPVDLLFLLDTSGSMEENAGMKSKWASVRDALTSFMNDPQSAGLGVGMETFPVPGKVCAKDSECGGKPEICGKKGACSPPANVAKVEAACYNVSPRCIDGQPCTVFGLCGKSGLRCTGIGQPCPGGMADDRCTERLKYCTDTGGATCKAILYGTPIVPIAELPGVRPALEAALAAVVPEGATPTTPAAVGALGHLRTRAMANADRKQLLVLATDGMPSMCPPNSVETAVAALRAGQMATPSIPTYVIGVFSSVQLTRAQPALHQMATAGGTGTPFILTTGDDLTLKFIEAINQIRNSAQTCEFMIPKPTGGVPLDYNKVNVRVTTATGNEDLGYVGAADRCDPAKGGWHYDVDPKAGTPTRVLLCESSCRKAKSGLRLSVGLRFGCKTIVVD